MIAGTSTSWLRVFRQYLFFVTLLHAGWEVLQLPLYTIWSNGSAKAIVFAVLHCTAGDAMIASLSLILALLLNGNANWPYSQFKSVALMTILFGVVYTIYSEWRNTVVNQNWEYTSAMPSVFGIGLSPVAQWVVIPGAVFWWIRRRLAAPL